MRSVALVVRPPTARGRSRAVALALVVAGLGALAAGCPGRTRRTLGGDPAVPETGDQRARQRFEETRARFQQDEGGGPPGATAEEFAAIATAFPDDPIAPHARLYAGMAALSAERYDQAIRALEEVVGDPAAAEDVHRRGQMFLGIALGSVGQDERALAALAAGQGAVASDRPDEQADYAAALAESSARLGRVADAIRAYDGWWAVGRPAEKVYAAARVGALAEGLDRATATTLFDALADKRGPAAALVGVRLAGLLAAAGDADAAAEVGERSAEARAAFGLVSATAGGSGGDPDRIGAILSLSGRRNRIGDASLRGLALASGAGGSPTGGLWPSAFALEVEDDGSRVASAGAAVDRLAGDDAIAVVGPIDGRAVEAAAVRAAALGVPLLSLTPAPELVAGGYAFHVVHSAERRARALARAALARKQVDFAILRPASRFGEEVGRAFADEVRRGGGQVIVEASYPANATAFTAEVAKLRKPFQALFVADQARALELIAPALAAANLVSRPVGEVTKQGRPILLLALADLIEPRFLRAAGRYAWGAILAPGFYADPAMPGVAEFAEAYARSFGGPPTAQGAYAFDAALLIRRAVEGGAETRADIASFMASARVRGLTGDIAFDAGRRRADDGILYRVDNVATGQFELRPLR